MKKIIYLSLLVIVSAACKTKETAFIWGKRSSIYPFSENGLWGFNLENGETIVKPKYEQTYLPKYVLARFIKNGKIGFMDNQGKTRIRPKYESASDFFLVEPWSYPPTIAAKIKHKSKEYFIDQWGEKIKEPNESYEKEFQHSTREAEFPLIDNVIKIDEGYELIYTYKINSNHDEPTIHTDTTCLKLDTIFMINGSFLACRNSQHKYGILFKRTLKCIPVDSNPFVEHSYNEGEYQIQIDFIYDDIYHQPSTYYDYVSHLAAKKDDKWGIVGFFGKTIVPFDYLSVKSLNGSKAIVEYEPNKFGYISFHHPLGTTAYVVEVHFVRLDK